MGRSQGASPFLRALLRPGGVASKISGALDSGLHSRRYDFAMNSIGTCPLGETSNQGITARTRNSCCSSPAAMCFWFVASLVAWGLLSLIGIYWNPTRAFSATTIYLAMAAGCGANWRKNRTLHCGITAPLFLIAGLISLLSETHVISVDTGLVWPFMVISVGVAFLVEWRYAGRSE